MRSYSGPVGDPRIEAVVTTVELPPGTLGPVPVSFEVRCFVVAGPSGCVLVDTATPGNTGSIDLALARLGAGWSDVTDIVLTHRHFDHTGGLTEAADRTPRANLWAGADDVPEILRPGHRDLRPAADGQTIGELRVLGTPGHTLGHISLLHEEASCLLIGDIVGSVDGTPTFGPPSFTADPAINAQSLRRVLELNPERILFSHGEELPDGARAVRSWLDGPPPPS
jgi:glyoxylase-like metal-dependent hydrolase (beta-lactamase superfamily II)